MNIQFDLKTAETTNLYDIKPEHVIMLLIAKDMKRLNFRSFKSYLEKFVENDKIQRGDVSIDNICIALMVDKYQAENIAVKWMNDKALNGRIYQHAGINTYYFSETLNIIN